MPAQDLRSKLAFGEEAGGRKGDHRGRPLPLGITVSGQRSFAVPGSRNLDYRHGVGLVTGGRPFRLEFNLLQTGRRLPEQAVPIGYRPMQAAGSAVFHFPRFRCQSEVRSSME
jgi:hypothetical protein